MPTTLVRSPQPIQVPDGIYPATITSIEPNIQSRYTASSNLVRIAFDLHHDASDHRPRLWLTTPPVLRGKLEALIRAIRGRALTEEEASTFDIEQLVNQDVGVVVAQGLGRGGIRYPRIVSFVPAKNTSSEPGQLESVLSEKVPTPPLTM